MKAGFIVEVGVVEMLKAVCCCLDVRGSGEVVVCGGTSPTRDSGIVQVYTLLTASF